MRGPSLIQRHLIWRGLRLAVLARLVVLAALLWSAGIGGEPFKVSSALAPAVVALTILLGWIESLRVGERVFLANLGVSQRVQSTCLAIGAIAAESSLAVLVTLARGAFG
jgi:hypothetical protein